MLLAFNPNSVANAVGEGLAIPGFSNDLPSRDIDTGRGRVFSHSVNGLSLCLEDNIPDLLS